MGPRQTYLAALRDPALREVNFVYEGFAVNYERLQVAHWLVSSCAVQFEELAGGQDTAGDYNRRLDRVRASASAMSDESFAIEVHEAIHILQDRDFRDRRQWSVWEAEGVAYLAEVVYLIAKHKDPSSPWGEYMAKIAAGNHRPVRRVAAQVAYDAGVLTQSGAVHVSRAQLMPLQQAVHSDPLYSPGTRDMNGVRNRSCRHHG